MSAFLNLFAAYIPHDFARRDGRGLNELARFKSTELHFILHHAGPVIFKGVISQELYDHFMLLHVAVRLLSDKDLCTRPDIIDYCRKLLRRFVELGVELYGPHFITINIHNLIHLADDVAYFQRPLYDF